MRLRLDLDAPQPQITMLCAHAVSSCSLPIIISDLARIDHVDPLLVHDLTVSMFELRIDPLILL